MLEWIPFNQNFIYADGLIGDVTPGGVATRLTLKDDNGDPYTWDINQFVGLHDSFGILIEDKTTGYLAPAEWTVTALNDNGTFDVENINVADFTSPRVDYNYNYDYSVSSSYGCLNLTVDGAAIADSNYIKKIVINFRWGLFAFVYPNASIPEFVGELQVLKGSEWVTISSIRKENINYPYGTAEHANYFWNGLGINNDGSYAEDYVIEGTHAELIEYLTLAGGNYTGMAGVRIVERGYGAGYGDGKQDFGILGDYLSVQVYYSTYDIAPIMKTITSNAASTIDNEDTDWDTTGVAVDDAFVIGYRSALIVNEIAAKLGKDINLATTTENQYYALRPSDDVEVGDWVVVPLWSKIEEVIFQPTLGDGDTIGCASTSTAIFETAASTGTLSMPDGSTAIAITICTYGQAGAADAYSVAYSIGAGAASSFKTPTQDPGSYLWGSVSWTGLELTKANIDDLRIHLKNTSSGAGTSYIDTIYVLITVEGYTWTMQKYIARKFRGNYCKEAIDYIKSVEGGYVIEDYENNRLQLLKESEFSASGVSLDSTDFEWEWTFENKCNQFKEVQLFGDSELEIFAFARDERTSNVSPKIKQIIDERVKSAADAQEIVDEKLASLMDDRPCFQIKLKGVYADLKVGTTVNITFVRPTIAADDYPIRRIERSKMGDEIITVIFCGMGESPIEEELGKTIRNTRWMARAALSKQLGT